MAGIHLLIVVTAVLVFSGQDVAGATTTPKPVVVIDGPGAGNEGDDMLLLPEQMGMMQPEQRKAISGSFYRWPEVNGFPEVPYKFADALVNQTAVNLAVAHWVEHTCLKFPEVVSSYSSHHIFFQRHATACNSYVGKVSNTGQPINVPIWCEQSFGSLVHEIGHAIGFFHEQSRSDRNDYVKINTGNIQTAALSNFDLATDNNYSVPYDFNSDMHYDERAFQSNGRITIATLNPLYQGVIGQRSGLSHMDKLMANRMYNCVSKNLASCSLAVDPCQNYGYMGKSCSCVCPAGTSGTNCQTLTLPYNDVNMSPFTQTITSEGTVTSPNYPSTTPPGEKYTKLIQAPSCQLIRLTFSDFKAIDKASVNGEIICYYEGLEIRITDMYDGTWYCGTDIAAGQVFTSTTNQMILFFKTNGGNYSPAKWSATVDFISDPACGTTSTPPSTTTSTPPSTTTTTPPSTTTTTPPSTTTTTPPSTTTSTPPTTTTTTTTTSTPPTTTTTTTTTSTPPTTTTTTTTPPTPPATTTTPKPAVPQCGFIDYGTGLKGFYSPNFPGRYPNNAICVLENNSTMPYLALLYIIKLKLSRGDKLVIEHPYGPPCVLTGSRRRPFFRKVPSHFRATFTSDSAYNKQGFLIKYIETQGRCHASIDGTTRGSVVTPGYPRKHWKSTVCEWKITVSPGMRVRLAIRIRKVTCNRNYVSIDKTPYDVFSYNPSAIQSFCGRRKNVYVTSDTNVVTVFYFGFKRDLGIKVSYSEVP
ncbi:protein SpAN-like [Macrobrachium nipponense]|uniref:protein SpAN-like n=1 Tax=Macrobrachium nipponense TaxID=159736 RepID=UPI0030C8415D